MAPGLQFPLQPCRLVEGVTLKTKQILFALTFGIALARCGSEVQLLKTDLEGNWKLVEIQCDGQSSTAITASALTTSPGPASWVQHTGPDGWVIWDVGTCVYKSRMEAVTMGGGHMSVQYADAQCGGSDCSTFPACAAKARVAELKYEVSAEQKLTVTIPNSEFGGSPPCGAGQTSGTVRFLYERYSDNVPHI